MTVLRPVIGSNKQRTQRMRACEEKGEILGCTALSVGYSEMVDDDIWVSELARQAVRGASDCTTLAQ